MSIEIFIDIETLPTSNTVIQERATADVAPPGNYKKAETIAQWWASEGTAAKQEAVAKTALDGTWGEVLCIGLAFNDEPVEVFMRTQTTEYDLLNTFKLMLDSRCKALCLSGHHWETSTTWIGHNLQDFDLRFLWQRACVNGILLPFKLPIGKPNYNRGPYIYDTMKEWAGYGKRVKQTDLELAFGIPRTDTITGADVYAQYLAGQLDVIKNHCQQDVESLRTIYRRMAA